MRFQSLSAISVADCFAVNVIAEGEHGWEHESQGSPPQSGFNRPDQIFDLEYDVRAPCLSLINCLSAADSLRSVHRRDPCGGTPGALNIRDADPSCFSPYCTAGEIFYGAGCARLQAFRPGSNESYCVAQEGDDDVLLDWEAFASQRRRLQCCGCGPALVLPEWWYRYSHRQRKVRAAAMRRAHQGRLPQWAAQSSTAHASHAGTGAVADAHTQGTSLYLYSIAV